jgi:pimeloyl-ACP methyl ester carboxylesterase
MLPKYRQEDTALVDEIIAMFERKSPDLFEIQMLALLGRPNATPLLRMILCPALVLTGFDDAWSPPGRHLEMAQSIPKSHLVVIPRCGHMSTMERPDEVTAAMREWLETESRRGSQNPTFMGRRNCVLVRARCPTAPEKLIRLGERPD